MKHTDAWKRLERTAAHRLGAVRLGATGRATADAESEALCIETKQRADLPQWLTAPLSAIRRKARPGQTPIVIWHAAGTPFDSAVVCLALVDFERLRPRVNERDTECKVSLDNAA